MSGKPPGFTHTPYAGTYKPFSIGMNLLDLDDWIEVDRRLPDYLAEKERLLKADRGAVFREEEGTRAAQQEVLDPGSVLHEERLVEAEGFSEMRALGGGKPRVVERCVAGQQVDEQEDDARHQQKQQRGAAQPAESVGRHRIDRRAAGVNSPPTTRGR